ncbi:glycosyltransferase [Malikia spinosa]|uniref:glycosyltransferase n=1 Tax=Malikia spinosa TaxID=86180 RepID=UPI0027BA2DD7|nr:glycosyltransferase [Malikia spinosa]
MQRKFNKIIAIGGIPNPIGGVTTFISRLAANNMVDEVIDLYPSESKFIPKSFHGNLIFVSGIINLYIFLLFNIKKHEGCLLHFNFSRERSIIPLLLIPKFHSKIGLMLHHGDLKVPKYSLFHRLALSRIDIIFCMNKSQDEFYKRLGVSDKKIYRSNSYISPTIDFNSIELKNEIDEFFVDNKTFICSGYPTGIYRHDWCINFVKQNPVYKLAIFLYGDNVDSTWLDEITSGFSNIKIFKNTDQNSFNYALKKCLAYLRPTKSDSFGIAAADAIEFKKPSIASNVCERHPGVIIFDGNNYESFEKTIVALLSGENVNRAGKGIYSAFKYPEHQ